MKRFASIFDFLSGRMMFILAAQVVLCLSVAPILSAQQWAGEPKPDGQAKEHHATIEGAFDADSARPEEISDSERTRLNKRVGSAVRTNLFPRPSHARSESRLTVRTATDGENLAPAPSPLYSGERADFGELSRAGLRGFFSPRDTARHTAPHPALSPEYRGEGETSTIPAPADKTVRDADPTKLECLSANFKFEISNRLTPRQAIPGLQPAAPPVI